MINLVLGLGFAFALVVAWALVVPWILPLIDRYMDWVDRRMSR